MVVYPFGRSESANSLRIVTASLLSVTFPARSAVIFLSPHDATAVRNPPCTQPSRSCFWSPPTSRAILRPSHGPMTSLYCPTATHSGSTGGAFVYDCASPDGVNRTVWLVPGQRVKEVMVVEGVFRLLGRPRGNGFPGFCEDRIGQAVRRW